MIVNRDDYFEEFFKMFYQQFLGKVEGCPKSEQTRLQTPERKNADIREKQASFYEKVWFMWFIFIV